MTTWLKQTHTLPSGVDVVSFLLNSHNTLPMSCARFLKVLQGALRHRLPWLVSSAYIWQEVLCGCTRTRRCDEHLRRVCVMVQLRPLKLRSCYCPYTCDFPKWLRELCLQLYRCRSQGPPGLRRGSVGSNPAGVMDVCCECCVLSDRAICDGPIPCLEESNGLWCVTRVGLLRRGGGIKSVQAVFLSLVGQVSLVTDGWNLFVDTS